MAKGFKTGGRGKGTQNKLTSELKEMINSILSDEVKKIPEQLNELDTKDRLNILVKLLPYAIPKIQSIQIEEEPQKELTEEEIKQQLKDLGLWKD